MIRIQIKENMENYADDCQLFEVENGVKTVIRKNNENGKHEVTEFIFDKNISEKDAVDHVKKSGAEVVNVKKEKSYDHILSALIGQPWAITEEYMKTIIAIADKNSNFEALKKVDGERVQNSYAAEVRGNVGILPVKGSLFRYANLFTQISGGTSMSLMVRDFKKLMDDPRVEKIVLDIDSPGGQVNGISEMADMIYQGRKQKKIIAYVGGYGASGSYWLAAATSEIVAADTSQIGSIGVVMTMQDRSAAMEKSGIKEYELVSRYSPNKRPDIKTEKGKEQIIDRLDGIAKVFIDKIAAYRGTDAETVLKKFGQGKVFIAEQAKERGMIDKIMPFENLMSELQEENMADETKKENAAPVISIETAADVKKNHPEIAEALINEGAEKERARIQGIEEISMTGYEKETEKAKFESKISKDEFAVQILKLQKQKFEVAKEKSDADKADLSGKIEKIEGTPADDQENNEKVIAGIVSGAEKVIKSKE